MKVWRERGVVLEVNNYTRVKSGILGMVLQE